MNKFRQGLLCLLGAACMMFAFGACGNPGNPNNPGDTQDPGGSGEQGGGNTPGGGR